jgi:hypothetical protein
MESKLGEWADGISFIIGIAIEGKTLRGSVKQGSVITHLLSAQKFPKKIIRQV